MQLRHTVLQRILRPSSPWHSLHFMLPIVTFREEAFPIGAIG
jgi:hypothetical protein